MTIQPFLFLSTIILVLVSMKIIGMKSGEIKDLSVEGDYLNVYAIRGKELIILKYMGSTN